MIHLRLLTHHLDCQFWRGEAPLDFLRFRYSTDMTWLDHSSRFLSQSSKWLKRPEPVSATIEACFLIAAFRRFAKSLSHSEQMGWLVGAVGVENNDERNFKDLRGMRRNAKLLKRNEGPSPSDSSAGRKSRRLQIYQPTDCPPLDCLLSILCSPQ